MKTSPLSPIGGIGWWLGGQNVKSPGKLANGWIDWHQLCLTYADSFGNVHRLKKRCLLETPWRICEDLGGQKLKWMSKQPNGWTNRDQLWHTCADSSGNGHSLNTSGTSRTLGQFRGFRGSTIQKSESCRTVGPMGTMQMLCTKCEIHPTLAI